MGNKDSNNNQAECFCCNSKYLSNNKKHLVYKKCETIADNDESKEKDKFVYNSYCISKLYDIKYCKKYESNRGQQSIHKISLIGENNCGKSSMVYRWIKDAFPDEPMDPTIDDFYTKDIKMDNDTQLKVELHDWAGHGNMDFIYCFEGHHIIILFYSLNRQMSLTEAIKFLKQGIKIRQKKHGLNAKLSVFLVCNQCEILRDNKDIEYKSSYYDGNVPVPPYQGKDKMIDTKNGMEVAKKLHIPYFEISVKEWSAKQLDDMISYWIKHWWYMQHIDFNWNDVYHKCCEILQEFDNIN